MRLGLASGWDYPLPSHSPRLWQRPADLLPATSKEAFLLAAAPQVVARHASVDTLSSGRERRPCTMRGKKREAAGQQQRRWARGSSRAVATRAPFLYHSMLGRGRPSARQGSVAGLPRETSRSGGCSTMRGIASSGPILDPEVGWMAQRPDPRSEESEAPERKSSRPAHPLWVRSSFS